MGSVTGVYDQQMINQAANLDNANMEAERRRRALKSQGATRPNKNTRRTNIQNIQAALNQQRENGNPEMNINSNEMTIHEIMSIQKVEAGQKTQR